MGILNIFKRNTGTLQLGKQRTSIKIINDYDLNFYNFGNDIYKDSTARACIDTIAKHAAKLSMKHLGGAVFNDLLCNNPNNIQTIYDFLYKIVTNLYVRNNVYIEVVREGNKVVALIPIDYQEVKVSQDGNIIYFTLINGEKVYADYTKDIIHLRRHYNKSFFGDDALNPILPSLEAMNTSNQGIVNAIRNGGKLRGLLKYSNSLRPEDKAAAKVEFENTYMKDNEGGIAILDSKADFIQLQEGNFKIVDSGQMAELRKALYTFFGVNENILLGTYNEEQYDSFYNSVIEPIAIQLSLEFTKKIFSTKEQAHGNEIIFSSDRLIFASNKTKAEMINLLLPLGVLSINEARTILELEPLEDDRRLMSLNYVNFDNADKYQLGKVNSNEDTNNTGGETDEGTTNNSN